MKLQIGATTLPWLLRSRREERCLRYRGANPEANGLRRSNDLRQEAQLLSQWRASFLWLPPEVQAASAVAMTPGTEQGTCHSHPGGPESHRAFQERISGLVPEVPAAAPRKKAAILRSFSAFQAFPGRAQNDRGRASPGLAFLAARAGGIRPENRLVGFPGPTRRRPLELGCCFSLKRV